MRGAQDHGAFTRHPCNMSSPAQMAQGVGEPVHREQHRGAVVDPQEGESRRERPEGLLQHTEHPTGWGWQGARSSSREEWEKMKTASTLPMLASLWPF